MRYKRFSFLPLFIFTLLLAGCGRARATPVPTTSSPPQATADAPPTSSPIFTEAPPTHTPPPPTRTPEATPLTPEPQPAAKTEVVYNSDLGLAGYLRRPEGAGPFPAVVYNHGGLGDKIGGAPEETCDALTAAGMVGFAPIRRQTIPLDGHMDDVMAAVNYVKGLEYVAPDRLGVMGFSRG